MSINDYKDALKTIIDQTNDEELLRHWKTHLEWESENYRKQHADESHPLPSSDHHKGDKDDTSGYVILESGLGIDE